MNSTSVNNDRLPAAVRPPAPPTPPHRRRRHHQQPFGTSTTFFFLSPPVPVFVVPPSAAVLSPWGGAAPRSTLLAVAPVAVLLPTVLPSLLPPPTTAGRWRCLAAARTLSLWRPLDPPLPLSLLLPRGFVPVPLPLPTTVPRRRRCVSLTTTFALPVRRLLTAPPNVLLRAADTTHVSRKKPFCNPPFVLQIDWRRSKGEHCPAKAPVGMSAHPGRLHFCALGRPAAVALGAEPKAKVGAAGARPVLSPGGALRAPAA